MRVSEDHITFGLFFFSTDALHLFSKIFSVCPSRNQERGQHCRNVEQRDGIIEFLHRMVGNQEQER